ncbi:carboxymuconolactone decarboxylase family protein [Streptomyces antimycoticus]|uniref:carboxymuconolactone decarboxylase family protein n=1 Tax=Streptomyces antimycoticus TaxID=68175 RepID=UPI0033D65CDF
MTTTIPARTTARLDLKGLAPEVSAAMGEPHRAAVRAGRAAGVGPELLELARIHASQLNGRAFCLDMHTKDTRAQGETEQRIHTLAAWRETPFFTERERAALAPAEAVTSVQDGQVPDEVYAAAREVFDEPRVTAVSWATVVINAYNRTAISTRMVPGAHQPAPRS